LKASRNIFVLLFFCCFILIGKTHGAENKNVKRAETSIVTKHGFPAGILINNLFISGTLPDEATEDVEPEACINKKRSIIYTPLRNYLLSSRSTNRSIFFEPLLQHYTNLPPPFYCRKFAINHATSF
jgi:hypothetical protein